METERAAIIELFRNGNTTAQILKALNIPMKRRNFVYRTINRFRETGSLSDKPRSGRPVTATTREMKSAVRSRVWRNPHRSVRKMALELKISRGSLRELGLGYYGKVQLMEARNVYGYEKLPVAVKTLSTQDEAQTEQFMREVNLMMSVHNEYIVSLLGFCLLHRMRPLSWCWSIWSLET